MSIDYKKLWETLFETYKNMYVSGCGGDDERQVGWVMNVEVMYGGYCEKDDYKTLWESLHSEYGCLTFTSRELKMKLDCSNLGAVMTRMKKESVV